MDDILIDQKTITAVMIYTYQTHERLYSQTQSSFYCTAQRCRLDPRQKTQL